MDGVLSIYLNCRNALMKWVSLLVLMVLNSACAGGAEQGTVNGWRIELVQSGGVAGLKRTTTVTGSGDYEVVNRAGNVVIQRLLSKTELAELDGRVTSSGLQKINNATNNVKSRCRDCYQYHLSIETENELLEMRVDSISLKNSPYHPVVSFLLLLAK